MGKQNKLLQYIIFGVPAAIAVYLIFRSLKGKKGQDAPVDFKPEIDNSSVEPTKGSTGGVRPVVTKYFPIKKGSKGAKVTELQQALIALKKDLGATGADGDFGTLTEKALYDVTKKYSVDSQEELNKIVGMKAAQDATAAQQQQVAAVNSQRIALANNILRVYNSLKGFGSFYFTKNENVEMFKVTSDGRELPKPRKSFSEGEKLYISRNSKINLNPIGFFKIYDGENLYVISPYAVEVK